ncbi:MAG: DNA-directed RNA polymerase subunit alpha [Acidobacteriota bacterium]
MKPFQMPTLIECNIETLTDRYGEFVAQPLERGWGITLGNALRRILLSSIEGAAISAVKIEGVLHEFTSVPGVLEDVTDVVLNLKAIQFIQHSDEPKTLRLSVQGPAEVKARDIQHDGTIRILNPDAPIATLNEEGSLDMEIILTKGRGYVPAEANKVEDPQYIAIDSIHSPVRKVNYEVTETRVGEATDYEKLKLEIWTNGAVTPQQALASAASLLTSHLELFRALTGPDAAVIPQGTQPVLTGGLEHLLGQALDETELNQRIVKMLQTNDVETVRDLVRMTEKDLQGIKNFGQKALKEVNDFLEKLDLTLGMNV